MFILAGLQVWALNKTLTLKYILLKVIFKLQPDLHGAAKHTRNRQFIEKYIDKKSNLAIIFIDLEKAYERVPRDELWGVLKKKDVPKVYEKIIQVMYGEAKTSGNDVRGETEGFTV